MDDNLFTILLCEIIQKFPKLRKLDLSNNEIRSIQPVADKIKMDASLLPSKSLRILNLADNCIMCFLYDHLVKDPKEKAAVLSFLKSCSSIHELEWGGILCDPDLEYASRINHAGRNLVEGWGDSDRVLLPLSVWHIVLEQAYVESKLFIPDYENLDHSDLEDIDSIFPPDEKNITGLYYLLREGPALAGRCDLKKLG
jgi:hypothetical protein